MEKYHTGILEGIENRVIRVKIEHPIQVKQKITNLSGLMKVNGHKSLITVVGADIRCLYCDSFGHTMKFCEVAAGNCKRCRKPNDQPHKCQLSDILATNEKVRNIEDLDDEEFELISDPVIHNTVSENSPGLIELNTEDDIRPTTNKTQPHNLEKPLGIDLGEAFNIAT